MMRTWVPSGRGTELPWGISTATTSRLTTAYSGADMTSILFSRRGLPGAGRDQLSTRAARFLVEVLHALRRPYEIPAVGPHRLRSGGIQAGGVADPAQQVLPELRLGEGRVGVASSRVPGPAAVEGVIPGDGVIAPHLPAGIARLVQAKQHGDAPAARVLLEVVPLVEAAPGIGQGARRGMVPVLDPDAAFSRRRMAREARA